LSVGPFPLPPLPTFCHRIWKNWKIVLEEKWGERGGMHIPIPRPPLRGLTTVDNYRSITVYYTIVLSEIMDHKNIIVFLTCHGEIPL
jgi:hypothetical protein